MSCLQLERQLCEGNGRCLVVDVPDIQCLQYGVPWEALGGKPPAVGTKLRGDLGYLESDENGMQTAPMPEVSTVEVDKLDPEMRKMFEAMTSSPLDPEENTVEWQLESGQFTYITAIRNRRMLIADQQKGLAVGFSNFYHDGVVKRYTHKFRSGKTEERDAFQGAFNLPAMHMFKIRNGLVYEIEAMGYITPYGTKSGWE